MLGGRIDEWILDVLRLPMYRKRKWSKLLRRGIRERVPYVRLKGTARQAPSHSLYQFPSHCPDYDGTKILLGCMLVLLPEAEIHVQCRSEALRAFGVSIG